MPADDFYEWKPDWPNEKHYEHGADQAGCDQICSLAISDGEITGTKHKQKSFDQEGLMHATVSVSEQRSKTSAARLKFRSTEAAILVRGALALAMFAALVFGAQSAHAQTETVLYGFKGNPDGAEPAGGMPVLDRAGNLYGATYMGGALNLGTVWKLAPSGTETVLWSFGNGTDGSGAIGLVRGKHGNLYGTTIQGGAYGLGTVFQVTPSGSETVLWNFGNGTDGTKPGGGVILDGNGNLYGTTMLGGSYNGGTVFELTPSGTETVLWSFGNGKDGSQPDGPVLNVNGTLYGTTRLGGRRRHGHGVGIDASGDGNGSS